MGGTEPIISILVPLYNCEKKIKRCVDSLKVQKPHVYEVIILDDGSTDAGYRVVQECIKECDNIRVYHQQNMGVAAARQKLIELAEGEYILFCDADDFIEPDTIEVIYGVLKEGMNMDAVIYGYNLVREHGKKSVYGRQLKEGLHQKSEFSKLHVNGISDLYWSSLWNKCYKTELCRSPQTIQFEKLLEDVMFNVDYLSRCTQVYVVRKPFYNYVQIGESLTRTKCIDDKQSICEAEEAYLTLDEKSIRAYPDEKQYIMKNSYIRKKKLMARAARVNDVEIQKKLYEDYCELKRKLGRKAMWLDFEYNLKDIKGKLKAVIRRK